MTNIAVFVSGGGTNLQALIDAQRSEGLGGGRLALVVASKPGVFALERAEKAGIPTAVVTQAEYGEEYEQRLVTLLEEYNIKLIVLAGFMTILSKAFIDRYEERIVNVHPSLIPSFCGQGYYGLRVHQAALEKGVKVTGATVHFVNEIPDGGRILLQKAVEVLPGDTPQTLQRRVMEQAEWKLLPEAVRLFCMGKL